MSEARDDPTIFWVDPEMRGVLALDGLHISKSLRKVLRKGQFDVTADTAFAKVIEACARPRPGQDGNLGTWINDEIIRAYIEMHHLGLAHSIECWQDGPDGKELVGGLYGISLKGAFMGESMFSARTNASKVALVHLVARLRLGGFVLLDTQFITEHLITMGGMEIAGQEYLDRLERAFTIDAQFPAEPLDSELSSELESLFAQSLSHRS